MNSYTYEAVNAAGLKCNGVLEGATQGEAIQRIRDMGLFPTRLRAQAAEASSAGNRPTHTATPPPLASQVHARLRTIFRPHVSARAVTIFTRQLATLVDAGMPLLRGLRVLERQAGNPRFQRIVGELATRIENGSALSESLADHPHVFNRVYVNMIRAGEASGCLDRALERLAAFREKAQRTRTRVQAALFYPITVMVVAATILLVLMVFVVPRFRGVLENALGNAKLPAFTTFVLGASDLLRNHTLLLLGGMLLAGGGFVYWLRQPGAQLLFDRFKLNLPVFGKIFRTAAISRFSRTLGTLLGSGVPILQALAIVRESVGNLAVGNVVGDMHHAVKEGDGLSETLRDSDVFPPVIVGMVDVGEQTGALPDMLMRIADDCDDNVDNAVGALTSILEPVMIVFLAVMVGSIVIGMFLPIIRIIDNGFESRVGGGERD